MNVRKVIAFGKSSFVISLPVTWMKRNRVKKGDVVFVDDEGDSVRIFTEDKDVEVEEQIFIVNVDKKGFKRIRREICSAFVNGASSIVVEGKDLAVRTDEIVDILHNLFAIEIVEQTNHKIVAKDVLIKNQVNLGDYIRRADNIVRSMLIDLSDPKFRDYEELESRQAQVIRIYLLLLKTFKSILNDQKVTKNLKISPEGLLMGYRYVLSLQKIGNSISIISRYMNQVKDKALVSKLIKEYFEHYVEVMNIFYKRNKQKAFALGDWREEVLHRIQERITSGEGMLHVRERMVRMYYELHEIIHCIYN